MDERQWHIERPLLPEYRPAEGPEPGERPPRLQSPLVPVQLPAFPTRWPRLVSSGRSDHGDAPRKQQPILQTVAVVPLVEDKSLQLRGRLARLNLDVVPRRLLQHQHRWAGRVAREGYASTFTADHFHTLYYLALLGLTVADAPLFAPGGKSYQRSTPSPTRAAPAPVGCRGMSAKCSAKCPCSFCFASRRTLVALARYSCGSSIQGRPFREATDSGSNENSSTQCSTGSPPSGMQVSRFLTIIHLYVGRCCAARFRHFALRSIYYEDDPSRAAHDRSSNQKYLLLVSPSRALGWANWPREALERGVKKGGSSDGTRVGGRTADG
jgi:hypothetical protein